jgi:hypothetical protein
MTKYLLNQEFRYIIQVVIDMGKIYDLAKLQKAQYNGSVCWRMAKHAEIVENHLNPGEEPIYVFCGQKNDRFYDIFTSCVVVLTNRRILIGQKRLLWGYFLSAITPDLYNDMEVYSGLIWGKITIDTIKEEIIITNLDKRSLPEIETNISEFMMNAKAKLKQPEVDEE